MDSNKDKDIHTVLQEEINNFKATSSRFSDELKYTNKVLILYQNLASNLHGYPKDLVPVIQMFWVCFRGFLISTQLMFEAHIPEAYTIVSRSAEAVASARKMSLHPEKIMGWIKREKDTAQPFRRLLGELFPKGDKLVSPQIFDIYELTTEYGRHPNFTSTIFFSDFGRMKTENKVDFNYCDIEDKLNLRRCVNYHLYAYLTFLSAFRVIFKKYLSKEWVNELELVESEYGVYKETLRDVFQTDK